MGPAKRARSSTSQFAFCTTAALPLTRFRSYEQVLCRPVRRTRPFAPHPVQCCFPLSGSTFNPESSDAPEPRATDAEDIDAVQWINSDLGESKDSSSDIDTEGSLQSKSSRGLLGVTEPMAPISIPISARAEALLEDISDRPEYYLSGVGAVSGGVLGSVVLSASLSAIETVPFLPDTLRVVGLGYVFWFLSKYLFSQANRVELAADIRKLLQEVREPVEVIGAARDEGLRIAVQTDGAERGNGVAGAGTSTNDGSATKAIQKQTGGDEQRS